MVEFVFGRHPAQKTEYVIEKMKEALKNGKRAILIVPEQQALFWDTVVAGRFEPTDAFNIETVSFTRLADSVFRRFGGICKQYVNEAEKTLLMWSAISSVSDKLEAFRSPDREDRYVPLMKRAVSEIKLYGISGEELISAADSMGKSAGSLPARLRDLALISAAYDTLLHSAHDDPDEIPDALADTLDCYDYFGGSAVFIDSFYTLTPKEMKVAGRVLSQADDTLITFAMSGEDRELPHTDFVDSYKKEMARICARYGLDVKITEIPDERKDIFAYLSAKLWDFGAEPYSGCCDEVTVVKCPDRYDEAILAGARIKELVAGGARFGDIACVAADFESLRGITDTELMRQGIPVYVSGRTAVTSQPAARLLLSCASIAAGGWKREDVIACARTGLCSLTADEADALEVYTAKWRIRGKKKFCVPDGWAMNPDGYTETESEWAKKLLLLANSAREKMIPPIEAFCESLPGTVKDVCTAAYKLLCDFDVYSQLCREVAAKEDAGLLSEAQKKSQVWQAVCNVLDTLVRSVPDAIVDARRFSALLRSTADTCTIGTIPDGIDRVALGSVGGVRLDSVKHLIVLGAKSGEFPRVPKEGGFFSDNDRKILMEAGIELAPDTVRKQREEMFRFGAAVTSPSDTLTVIIPSDSSGNHPSLGAVRLTTLLPEAKILDFTSPEAEKILRTSGNILCEYENGALSADGDCVSGKAKDSLFDRDIALTQSRIECFTACAFQYYCRYVLRLDEGNAAELKPAEVGTFVHAILENFMREAAEEGSFPIPDDIIVNRCERLIREYREKIAPQGADGYVDYLFTRLTRSIMLFARSLSDEFAQSRFVPYSFELPVGFSKDLPAIPTALSNGHSMTIRGIVDRVDVMRENGKVYIRVADYKTGSKKFSLTDVMKGHNIQLLLYLFALCDMPGDCSYAKALAPEGESIVPAGAVYFSARPGDILSDDMIPDENAEGFALDAISRTGIVLGDEEIIRAMDSEMSGKYAPASLSPKGKLKGCFAESEEDFLPIREGLDTFLRGVGDRLTGGEAASLPEGYKSSSPCQYCAMMPLCRHNDHSIQISKKGADDSNG